jgi:serine/threonine protein kinase
MTSPLPTARSLFQEALDLPSAAARKAFLEQACQNAPELRTAVEALLTAYQSAGSFLELPAADLQPIWSENRSTDRAADTDCGITPPGNLPLDFLLPPREPGHLGRLAHYEVLEIIGRGGMGVVLKAIDENLQRVVAIKVLAPHLATSGSARQRFVREARAAAAVRNDHVVSIYAVEEPQGLPYLVMECIAGTTLQELLDASGALQTTEILRIGVQVAAGLTAAHAQGLIHRDIKPANILLENGVQRVKITDFGLARVSDDASLTQSGVLAGTPQYMSPEQAQGLTLDARSDLFSLGCVLYALCTGKPPFRAETTLATVRRVCEDTPHSIRDINPEVPHWLVDIVDRLLAKQPAERFQSAQEVADLLSQRLAEIQQGTLPIIVTRPREKSDPRRGQAWRSSPLFRRWLPTATAALVLLGVALSLTEASGVTHLAATIIRIFTPEGTLVVEVEDPQVQVTIQGNGGLSIKGAGPQEVRLHPGKYQVEATKDGKPVSRKLVEITRGDRKVVTVTHEPLLPQIASIPRLLKPAEADLLSNGAKGSARTHAWEFTWSEVPGASSYELYVVGPTATKPIIDATMTATSKRVEFSEGYHRSGDGWHWKVRAKVNGAWGSWSESWVFRVETPAEEPAVVTNKAGSAVSQFAVLNNHDDPSLNRAYASFAEAILKSADSDTIEIRGDGPFTIEPIRLTSRRVIRAGKGFRPVLRIHSPTTPTRNAPRFLESVAPLILEGLEFQSGNPNAWTGVTTLSRSGTAEGALYVANCRFVQCGLMAQYVSACQIRNCEMYRREGNPFGFFTNSNSLTAVIDNTIAMSGANVPAVGFGGDVTGQRINLSRNFLAGQLGLGHHVPDDKLSDEAKPVPVESSQNIWFGSSGAVRFNVYSDSPIPVEWKNATRLEALLGKVFAWRENRNLYPEGVSLLSLTDGPGATTIKPTRPYTTLSEWNQIWGITDTDSIQGTIRCQGGDVYQKLILAPEKLTPEDFRLREGSAGYRAGDDGKDLGPDIDFVGTGEAYERWKTTPDYQQWLKETGQLN